MFYPGEESTIWIKNYVANVIISLGLFSLHDVFVFLCVPKPLHTFIVLLYNTSHWCSFTPAPSPLPDTENPFSRPESLSKYFAGCNWPLHYNTFCFEARALTQIHSLPRKQFTQLTDSQPAIWFTYLNVTIHKREINNPEGNLHCGSHVWRKKNNFILFSPYWGIEPSSIIRIKFDF